MYNFIIVVMLVAGTLNTFLTQYIGKFDVFINVLLAIQYILYVAMLISGYLIGRKSDERFKSLK